MEEVKNEIDALIQQKEKEIKIWQDMLNEIKFEGLTVMYKLCTNYTYLKLKI